MNSKKLLVAGLLAVASSMPLPAQSVYPGQHAGKLKKETVAPMQVVSFDLQDVRLLLHSFRTTAGVFSGREGGYMTVKKLGGWESLDCELRGHTTGHLLSAYALMYAATGSEIFKLKGDSLTSGLAEVQAPSKVCGVLGFFLI